MIEKYGILRKDLPVEEDQMKMIGELLKGKSADVSLPKNAEEADELIEKLAKESE